MESAKLDSVKPLRGKSPAVQVGAKFCLAIDCTYGIVCSAQAANRGNVNENSSRAVDNISFREYNML